MSMPDVLWETILVAKMERSIFSKSYGLADLEWSVQILHDSIQHRFDDEAIHRSLDLALEDRGKLKTDEFSERIPG